MKKLFLLILLITFVQNFVLSEPAVYIEDGRFGLKDENGGIIAPADYKKLIRLGESAWIAQSGSMFGLMDDNGDFIVEPKYSRADRVLGKFAKLHRGGKWGLFDEKGFEVLPVEYSSIDLLFGGMFLTCKNYKYGVTDINGQPLLDNIFDDIYMPKPNIMMITYNGRQYEVERVKSGEFTIPANVESIRENSDFKITELMQNPAAATGYYGITAANYVIKIISSISPAYEETIDELMFSQGADAAGVIMKFTWLPRFPFVYANKYYNNLIAPNNGPLNGVKTNLKKHLSE